VWYVSHVDRNMGRVGIKAVNAPTGVGPKAMAAVSSKLARVQLSESIP